MAKVTLVIEDVTYDKGASVTIGGDFDEPGKSYEEMVANPTYAVAMGLGMIEFAKQFVDSYAGRMEDEFGNVLDISGGKV